MVERGSILGVATLARPMLRASTLLILTLTVAAQEEVPSGNVRDPQGRPVAGAKVGIRWLRGHSDSGFQRAIEQLVREQPLPTTLTDAQGNYSLALSREQTLLGCCESETFAFVVESPGFQRWVEPLPHGVRSFCGSDVTLVPLQKSDELRFLVADPEPGMWLLVRRSVRCYTADFDLDPGELVPVPADGRVVVRLPLLPSPAIVPRLTRWCGYALDAQVLFPGRSRTGISVDPTIENVVRPGPRLQATGTAWSALYRAPNGAELSFEVATPEAPADDELVFLRRADASPPPLAPPGPARNTIAVRVLDDNEAPIVGAMVMLGSVLDTPEGELGSATFRTDERGEIRFTNLPGGRYSVIAVAPGHDATRKNVDLGSEVTLTLTELPKVLPRVVASSGLPLAFRWFKARDVYDHHFMVRTDGNGRLPPAPIDMVCVGEWTPIGAQNAALVTVPDGPHFAIHVPLHTVVVESRHDLVGQILDPAPRTTYARGTLALLSLPLPNPQDATRFRLLDGSVLRIRGTDGAWLAERGGRLVTLDARHPEATVTLTVRGQTGLLKDHVLVTPKLAAIGLTSKAGRPLAEANPDGTWSVRVRSTEPLRCWVTHPDHVPAEIEIPPIGAQQVALEIVLVPGVPFSWRKPSPRVGETNRDVQIARLVFDKKELEFLVERVAPAPERIPPAVEEGILERAPFALPKGSHLVYGISNWMTQGPLEVAAQPGALAELDLR